MPETPRRRRAKRPVSDPTASHVRRVIRRRVLLGDVCRFCGEGDVDALVAAPRARLLEWHHIVGEGQDADLVDLLCRNCHAKASAGQLDLDLIRPKYLANSLERLARTLKARGLHHDLLATSDYRLADELTTIIECLDQTVPQWRGLSDTP